MKLKKSWSREYKGKKYYKFSVVIPTKALKQLGWKAGDELKADIGKTNLIIEKK